MTILQFFLLVTAFVIILSSPGLLKTMLNEYKVVPVRAFIFSFIILASGAILGFWVINGLETV